MAEQRDRGQVTGGTSANRGHEDESSAPRLPELTLFFFSADGSKASQGKYDLLLRCAAFGDENNFRAIWTPERHFAEFGGLYPNPAVLGAAIAARTRRIEIRAGSVVLPLHHPIRIAEEWAVVDNLSGGRVALAFASGWHKRDFALNPQAYAERRERMAAGIDTVRRLWRGESVTLPGGDGHPEQVTTFPRPLQPELRCWLTCSSASSWAKAGTIGANVLSMVGSSLAKLRENIASYRAARREAGHDPSGGLVSVMLHTYVDDDVARAKARVRGPLRSYLEDYVRQYDGSVDEATRRGVLDNKEGFLDFAFERYFESAALLGPRDKCRALLAELARLGVNEVACLLDFGLPMPEVLSGLELLATLQPRDDAAPARLEAARSPASADKARALGNRLEELSPAAKNKLLSKLASRSRAPEAPGELWKSPTSWLTLDRRSLASLILAGEEPPVDAVSITCLSDRVGARGGDLRPLTDQLSGDMPLLTNIRDFELGRIATLTLPRTYAQIYSQSEDIVRLVQQSMRVAATIGAKAVSLTGLIPSATDYGRAIHVAPGADLPKVTTGHATTISSVALALKRLLDDSGRSLRGEDLCFIGLGSVGSSTLRLLLKAFGAPRSLMLCDVFGKRAVVESLIRELREEIGYDGELRFLPSRRVCPDEVYDATAIVGATNVANVLDVERLRPGTLIVDDSDPHCFDAQQAIRRFESKGDILFTEGGALRVPDVVRHRMYVPPQFEWALDYPADDDNAHHITGCILSSLLSAKYEYPTTIGDVKLEDGLRHLSGLVEHGFTAANLHCQSYRLPIERIAQFRATFGRDAGGRDGDGRDGRRS
jgi:natural product biosynthesis luciferase-like monooxygenase protein